MKWGRGRGLPALDLGPSLTIHLLEGVTQPAEGPGLAQGHTELQERRPGLGLRAPSWGPLSRRTATPALGEGTLGPPGDTASQSPSPPWSPLPAQPPAPVLTPQCPVGLAAQIGNQGLPGRLGGQESWSPGLGVSASWGFPNKAPQAGRLKQQRLIFSPSWSLDI